MDDLEIFDPSSQASWKLAADNHNIGNTGGSWYDPSTWADKAEGALKMAAVSMTSGAASLYNSGVAVGNILGGDFEEAKTKDILQSFDSDLARYYQQNQESADLIGFIVTSLAPGIGGVKLLNAGQKMLGVAINEGRIGNNLSRATGLLVPKVENYVSEAASAIASNQATFSAINQAGVKALANGVWQNTLEGLAFEAGVQATMFKSPLLEQQDSWDIVKNLALGGAVGGVVGGAFQGVISYRSIYKQALGIEAEHIRPYGARVTEQTTGSASDSIIWNAWDRDVGVLPMPNNPYYEAAKKAYDDRLVRINNDIRTNIHKLAGDKNKEVGNLLADMLEDVDHKKVLQAMLHVDEIGAHATSTAVEKEIKAYQKANGFAKPLDKQVSYVKLTGEGAGEVVAERPAILNLSDILQPKTGEAIEDVVLNKVRANGFNFRKPWYIDEAAKGAQGHLMAEARQIWASKIIDGVPEGAKIHQWDLPVLERALKDGQLDIKLVDKSGAVLKDKFLTKEELENHIVTSKKAVAEKFSTEKLVETNHELAKITNQTLGRLEGTKVLADGKDLFAWQHANEKYEAYLKSTGRVPATSTGTVDLRYLPTYAKVAKRLPEDFVGTKDTVIDGMTWLKQKQVMAEQAVENTVALHAPELLNAPKLTQDHLMMVDREGAGAKLLSSAEGTYGNPKSIVNMMGSMTKKLQERYRQDTQLTMEGALAGLGRNQNAAIEWHTINQKISRSGELWVKDEEGNLIKRKVYDELKAGKEIEVGPDDVIEILNGETRAVVDAHMSRYAFRRTAERDMRASQGYENHKSAEVFHPIRPNAADYPYVAFVKDPTVTGAGHTTMIFAASEKQLAEMIQKVPTPYKVYTKTEAEDFYKARNDYDFQRTLHENYIDSDLKSKGVYSEFFTKTDPQKIVNDTLQQHLRDDDILAREFMKARNQASFDYLIDQGEAYTKYSGKIGRSPAQAEKEAKNPYLDYVRTALNVSKISEYPTLSSFNRLLDTAVSKVMDEVYTAWNGVKKPEDLDKINDILFQHGMKNPYMDTATLAWANHTAPKGELTKFVRGANAVLSKLTLGLDPMNSLVNAIGSNVLRGTELKQLTDAIKSGDGEIAGALSKLTKIGLPGGVGSITSPSKLIGQAIQNFAKDDGALLQKYKDLGYVKGYTEQFKQIMDDFTLKGTETVADLNKRLTRAIETAKGLSETGEKLTGNKWAEEFNRFISANVMDQITDVAVKKGLLSSNEANAYINTFVNRVEGNTIASQRPMIFQGPVGQAVGLFQSYQFNLMQQMFRYVAEGTGKDAAMLLGLQGTFFGMQGLPAFNFINQHIVGSLSGNREHRDLYDATYGIAGKQMGDWLMYGLPSNMLQANIYTRGDINPRQVTVIPTSLPDIPVVQAFGKFFGSVYETIKKTGAGAPVWESFLQGLEHNGISRPLAGLAQSMQAFGAGGQVYSTSGKGTVLYSNDLMSWSTAVRLAGGKPLDEAIVNDGVYRIQAYSQMNRDKMNLLAESIKAATIQGNQPDAVATARFAEEYAKAGGKQWNFNKFMMHQYTQANTPRANEIAYSLTNPFANKMQLLMGYGGEDTLTGSY